jgi:hypothetical protein
MDLVSLLRTLGGLGTVLGILAGALWLVRRYDLRLPGRSVSARDRRLELIETLPIDGRRMVALLRRDGREHLILVAPEGHLVLESGAMRDPADLAAAEARNIARADAARARDAQRHGFTATLTVAGIAAFGTRVRNRVGPARAILKSLLERDIPGAGPPHQHADVHPAEHEWPIERFATLVDRTNARGTPAWLVLQPQPDQPSIMPALPWPAQPAPRSARVVRGRKLQSATKEINVA